MLLFAWCCMYVGISTSVTDGTIELQHPLVLQVIAVIIVIIV